LGQGGIMFGSTNTIKKILSMNELPVENPETEKYLKTRKEAFKYYRKYRCTVVELYRYLDKEIPISTISRWVTAWKRL
jgi:hypothetical protein